MPYSPTYESPQLRGTEDPRPWNLISEIKMRATPKDRMLDIGCGTASKLIALCPSVSEIVGLEPNASMRQKAHANAIEAHCDNLHFVEGRAEALPFSDNSFDIVTGMLAPLVTTEVHRVLKPGGWAVVESIGEQDKENLKACFPNDAQGKRGHLSHFKPNERSTLYQEEFGPLFSSVEIRNGFWKTYYTEEGLVLLLEQTPTIRDFDIKKDASSIERIKKLFSTENGIATTQHRILVMAQK